MKFILDPKLGGKIRSLIQLVAAVGTVATAADHEIAAAGGIISIPVVLSILAHYFPFGNAKG